MEGSVTSCLCAAGYTGIFCEEGKDGRFPSQNGFFIFVKESLSIRVLC